MLHWDNTFKLLSFLVFVAGLCFGTVRRNQTAIATELNLKIVLFDFPGY